MSPHENRQVVLAMLEHWPDPDALEALATDDFELVIEADPSTKSTAGSFSLDETLAMVRGAMKSLVGTKVEIKGTTVEGDRVSVELFATAKVRDSNGEIDADREFRMRAHHLFVLRDGKIARIHEYADSAFAVHFFSPVERNKRIALELLDRWLDTDFLESISTDDLEFVVEADPRYTTIAGTKTKEHIKESWRRSFDLVDQVQVTPKGVTAEGNRVAIEAEGRTVIKGKDGTPDRDYLNRIHFLLEFRDGRLCRAVEYVDTAMIAAQFEDAMAHIIQR
jgi:ketosteroid isomerase-like protein